MIAERERRYQKRKADLEKDTRIDPRRRAWYLDRTLWDTGVSARELSISSGRISELRGARSTVTQPKRPHPTVFPETDKIVGYVAGVPNPANEAGAVRQWAVERHTHILDLDTGKLKKVSSRHGRPRHGRTTQSKVHKVRRRD